MRSLLRGVGVCGLVALASSGCIARHVAGISRPPTSAAASQRSATRFASPYTYEWFIRAELQRASGHLDEAIEAYRAALAGADDSPELMARLATALDEKSRQGDPEAHARALGVLDEALALDPDSEAVWLARAEVFARAAQLGAAYDAYEHAEYVAPASARGPLALAALLREHGHVERATAVLLRFQARILPGSADGYAAELSRALASAVSEAIFDATLPYRLGQSPMAADALLEAARFLMDHAHPEQALRVLAVAPQSQLAASLQLRALVQVGSLSALDAWLTDHEPADFDERLFAARAQLLLGRPEAAAQSIEAEQLLHPTRPELLLTAADVALARGDYAHAAELYARVPKGARASESALLGLQRALAALGLTPLAAELTATSQ